MEAAGGAAAGTYIGRVAGELLKGGTGSVVEDGGIEMNVLNGPELAEETDRLLGTVEDAAEEAGQFFGEGGGDVEMNVLNNPALNQQTDELLEFPGGEATAEETTPLLEGEVHFLCVFSISFFRYFHFF